MSAASWALASRPASPTTSIWEELLPATIGCAALHGLEQREPEALVERRKAEDRASLVEHAERGVGHLIGQDQLLAHAPLRGELPDAGDEAVVHVAAQDELVAAPERLGEQPEPVDQAE